MCVQNIATTNAPECKLGVRPARPQAHQLKELSSAICASDSARKKKISLEKREKEGERKEKKKEWEMVLQCIIYTLIE